MNSSCPDCENTYTDAQIDSGEVVPCVRCYKCFVGECGKTTCDCVFSDEEEEDEPEGKCDCCDAALGDDEHIFVFTRGDEEKTMCQMCGDDTHAELKAEGWIRDDDDEKDEVDEEGESDDSWEPDCCKCGTTTDSKGMGGVEHREDLCGWYCGRCYENYRPEEKDELCAAIDASGNALF